MRQISYSLLFVLFVFSSYGQAHRDAYRQGLQAIKFESYETAIEKFQEAVKINPQYADAWYYLGKTYDHLNRYEETIMAFRNLESVDSDYNISIYYDIAKSYIELENLRSARIYIKRYLEKASKGPKSQKLIHLAMNRLNYIDISQELREMPPNTSEPEPIASVNSVSGDYMPSVNPTGTRLYFTSVRQGGFDFKDENSAELDFGEDIYFSKLIGEEWSTPELLPKPINSMSNDFGSAFTGDGQNMVFVRCDEDGAIGSCDLYITQLNGSTWSVPVNMGNVVNDKDWDSQPTINSDGNRIIFTSRRSGGYGGSDLYMVEKNHLGLWGVAQNLGSIVNTPLTENSPFLAADGKTLYFSSTGHPGMGGADVFYTVFENGKWSTPKNLGKPINSKGNDTNFSISAAGNAYLASSRLDENNFDIFKAELPDELKPKPTIIVQGIVSNSEDKKPLSALVLIEDLNSGELIATNKSNTETGEYLVVLPAGRDYSVSANAEGFFFYSQSFELPKDTAYVEITNDIALEPIRKGTKVVLNNIFFEVGKAELKPISYVELNKAVTLMKNNKSMKIEVGGHTDNVGADANNLSLSQKRAQSVVEYMVLAGIERERLIAKGYGETVPIADNSTKEGRAKNRRTEFVIVEF
ncbi:WD40-like Beta Propeller Repeat [Ekhidna lutea]|uniref:WD40-like Beta Propeller Repeat n=1 Tax=Ekhidna lutea TaxID=447679 RepID=A0A239GIU0_EKHLU|nr:OmpA family protein [Ekhidna lutea]SNS69206.1 WD40-like Beta Propeller Repeat [Ekhidna lutea]